MTSKPSLESFNPYATLVPLGLAFAALLVESFGLRWDVSWHRTVGRDTFWSPPHLFLYAGVAGQGLVALGVALATTLGGRRLPGRELRLPALRGPLGYGLLGLGAAIAVGAAPFDDFWHNRFGRDVDIWSPPHLVGIFGGGTATLGLLAAALAAADAIPSRRLRTALLWLAAFLFGGLLQTCLIAGNWYWMDSAARDSWRYPAWLAAFAPVWLVAANRTLGWRWGATAAAGLFIAFNLAEIGWELATRWRAIALAPLILPAACLLDILLALADRGRLRAALLPPVLGVVWAVAFYAAEWLRFALYPARALRVPRADVLWPHLEAAREHPWALPDIAAAFPVVLLLAAASALLGLALARSLGWATEAAAPEPAAVLATEQRLARLA